MPDSSWFTNRIYAKPLSTDEITRGPNTTDGPAPGKWTVIRGKGAGVAPGFTARDEKGDMWFVSFDGARQPDGADRRDRGRDAPVLGARILPGRELPDDAASRERGRSEDVDRCVRTASGGA